MAAAQVAARRKLILAKLAEKTKSEAGEGAVIAALAEEVFDFLDSVAAIRVAIERVAIVAMAINAKGGRR